MNELLIDDALFFIILCLICVTILMIVDRALLLNEQLKEQLRGDEEDE